MAINGREFIRRFEEYCPLWMAEEGDPVGLHIGTLDKPIQKIMMTLDVRPEVVEEAKAKNIDLLIAKHPPIFRPIKRLTSDDPQNRMYMELVKNDIAVYAAHTNMDIIWDGLNDWFCEMLDVEVSGYLTRTHVEKLKKLVVYVPKDNAEKLRQALGDAGAGQQGNYHHTSFTSHGEGRFTPTAEAQPAIGKSDQAEVVEESRVEVLYREFQEQEVLAAMFANHPYEEPAYDLLSLDNHPVTYGLGRVGSLSEPQFLDDFVEKVKKVFELEGLRLVQPVGAENPLIQKIAICGGSGAGFYPDALVKGADVYLTGDVSYHTAHDMQAHGLTVIDPGHNIERVCIPRFVEKMKAWKKELNWDVEIIPSTTNTNPFQYK
ncbi:Nif3-like dinuclear metal center hexameric protein [Enterococcus asini]|uniref:Nif3-like dinuclear metal center hexameric protein n=1 Tax=Enterococcus asini TaxID=57732 RepID=UPI00288C65D9|nr:Nif3-like dinuclear metal center hexameric protein [Enterococcus asini]MDT2756931.1 Nif3-like dinuclear metal center hexameric protein [Enterococcus asini]